MPEHRAKSSKSLAAMGRGGDTLLGHLTPGDVIIPKEWLTPQRSKAVRSILGGQAARFTAGSRENKKNPRTGLPEFSEGESGGGAGDPGGGSDPGGGGAGLGGLGAGGVDTSGVAGTAAAGAQAAEASAAGATAAGTQAAEAGAVDTATHAQEVAASPAADPSTAGLAASYADQPGFFSNMLHGLASTVGLNTTNAPGLGLQPGPNANLVNTAASLIGGLPGAALTAANYADKTITGQSIGEQVGLATPERGVLGTLADAFSSGPSNSRSSGPSFSGGAGPSFSGGGTDPARSGDPGSGWGGVPQIQPGPQGGDAQFRQLPNYFGHDDGVGGQATAFLPGAISWPQMAPSIQPTGTPTQLGWAKGPVGDAGIQFGGGASSGAGGGSWQGGQGGTGNFNVGSGWGTRTIGGGMAGGGIVRGRGGVDSQVRRLTPGEGVLNPGAMRMLGPHTLFMLNAMGDRR